MTLEEEVKAQVDDILKKVREGETLLTKAKMAGIDVVREEASLMRLRERAKSIEEAFK